MNRPPLPPRPTPLPRLPLLASQKIQAWPKHADAPHVRYYSLDAILTRSWTTDAHMAAYSVEVQPNRLTSDAITSLNDGVAMVLFVVDVDCELAHAANGGKGDAPAPDAWWLRELEKLDQLRQELPGAFVYRTRGGYRIVYWLQHTCVLCSKADAQRWRESYLGWVAVLRRRHSIYADPACADWTRLYRVPHATRDPGGRPEQRDTMGNPHHIGMWACESTGNERRLAQTLAKRMTVTPRPREHVNSAINAGDGVLFYAFEARGWIGEALEPGKWCVRCPWNDRHTKGTDFDSSTILYAPGAGETLGWLHCSHAHCQTRDIRAVLDCFTRGDLSQAERAAGLMVTSGGSPRRSRVLAMPTRPQHTVPLMLSAPSGRPLEGAIA